MSEIKVTLIPEDFEISPALATDGYSVGMEVIATTTPPYVEGDGWSGNAVSSTEETLFVGGHPIKGRNG
jgi:hypothetical protein